MRHGSLVMLAAAILFAGPVAAPAADEWQTVRSEPDNFETAFPGPTEYAAEANPANQSEQHSWVFAPNRFEAYAFTVYQRRPGALPKAPDQQYYQGVAKAYADSGKCTLRDPQSVVIAGYPAFEAACDHEKGNILDLELHHLMDIVVVGDRLYLILSTGPKGHETTDDAKRFRDSFKLLAP